MMVKKSKLTYASMWKDVGSNARFLAAGETDYSAARENLGDGNQEMGRILLLVKRQAHISTLGYKYKIFVQGSNFSRCRKTQVF